MRNILLILFISLSFNSCQSQINNTNMNKLKYSSSPYLQQHANNPVHWQEWGEEALNKAKAENKPLLISIGYAACHWCHVMEHESFSDEEVADFMNKNFVCIKVDREERPDVDRVYMDAAQLINGQGGWPLNAFALPNGKPFFAGTYFSKSRWMNVLEKISELYKNDNKKIVEYADQLTLGINSNKLGSSLIIKETEITTKEYEQLFEGWIQQIDFSKGGFNRAPKFPLPIAWEFLLQYHYLTGNKDALNAVITTLDEMAKGGIYDQIAGGFARYSVDAEWKVPHFEKMLYDNAQLVSLYSHAYQLTRNDKYKEVVEQTLEFVNRELSNDEGGFYSSLNADSEGEEGKFYVFTASEFKEAVNPELMQLISEYYQISEQGNWEDGKNILLPKLSRNDFAMRHKLTLKEFNTFLKKANLQLFNYREKRERPSTDDKVLTSWNALMLKAYIDAFKAFENDSYLELAIKNAEFLEAKMIKGDNSLFRNYMNEKVSIDAFMDDYAFLAQAYMDLYSVTFNKHWLELSKNLTDYCIKHFLDKETNLFYYTSNLSESLIARKHEITDNVIPGSNSVMANVLFKLGHYFDNQEYLKLSGIMLSHFKNEVKESGPWYANWAILMGLQSFELYEVAIMGKMAIPLNHEMQINYLPNSLFLGGIQENLPLLKHRLVNGKTLIYVCKNKICKLPVTSIKDAQELIN